MSELIVASNNPNYERAVAEAGRLDSAQLHLAVQEAGFDEWLASADKYRLANIGNGTSEALRMPFPSPVTQAFRDNAGFASGVVTEARSRWTLAVAEDLTPSNSYDTGVRLVCRKRESGTKNYGISLPLDMTIEPFVFREAHRRPDRVEVEIGERQLPHAGNFKTEDAQRLLIVAAKFLEIVGSGRAAELSSSTVVRSKWRGLGRVLGSGS